MTAGTLALTLHMRSGVRTFGRGVQFAPGRGEVLRRRPQM